MGDKLRGCGVGSLVVKEEKPVYTETIMKHKLGRRHLVVRERKREPKKEYLILITISGSRPL